MEQQDRYIRFDWAVKRLLRQKSEFRCTGRIPDGSSGRRSEDH